MPPVTITVVHRSDGSGKTFIFSEYLSKTSEEWKEKVGTDKTLRWHTGLEAKGNSGIAGLVQQTPGSIGYVELIYTDDAIMHHCVLDEGIAFLSKPFTSTSLATKVREVLNR